MAVSNSLAKRQETSFTAYLKNDAVKNQINEVLVERTERDSSVQ